MIALVDIFPGQELLQDYDTFFEDLDWFEQLVDIGWTTASDDDDDDNNNSIGELWSKDTVFYDGMRSTKLKMKIQIGIELTNNARLIFVVVIGHLFLPWTVCYWLLLLRRIVRALLAGPIFPDFDLYSTYFALMVGFLRRSPPSSSWCPAHGRSRSMRKVGPKMNEAAIAQYFDSIFFDSIRLGGMQSTVTRRDGSWYRSKSKSNDPCHNPPLVITVEDSILAQINTTRSIVVVIL